MSVLDSVLKEEFDRMEKIIEKINEEIEELPVGYISKKKINDKEYLYLQKREGKKISSEYIKKDQEDSYKLLVQHRKELEQQKKKMLEEQKKIAKVISVRA